MHLAKASILCCDLRSRCRSVVSPALFASLLAFVSCSIDAAPTTAWSVITHGTPVSMDASPVDTPYAMAVDPAGNAYVTGAALDGANDAYGYNILTIKYDANGVEQWRAYAGGRAFAIAVDAGGNVYVTGDSPQHTIGSFDYRNYQTIKYSPNGAELWRARAKGSGNVNDVAYAVAVDSGGNVYVTGSSNDVGWGPWQGSVALTVKYNASGVEQWRAAAHASFGMDMFASGIATDATGNVYIGGATFDPYLTSQYFVLKYSAAGIEQWRNVVVGNGYTSEQFPPSTRLALDQNGNIFLSGTVGLFSTSSFLTVKYAPNGAEQWRALGTGGTVSTAYAIAVDANGNAYVTGSTRQDNLGTSLDDYLTIKYDPNGAEVWRANANAALNLNVFYSASALAVDNGGGVFVTGESNETGARDYLTIKYDALGVAQWRATGGGTTSASPSALRLDGLGNVYVTGFDNNGQRDEFLTVKYNASGIEQWRASQGSVIPVANFGHVDRLLRKRAMAVDQGGNVYLAGDEIVDGSSSGGGLWLSGAFLGLKLDSNGVEQWRTAIPGLGNAYAAWPVVQADGSGNVYVAGASDDASSSSLVHQYLTIRYDHTGLELWRAYANIGTGYEFDQPTALTVDATGNVYVTGAAYPSSGLGGYLTIKYDANGFEQWRAFDGTCYATQPYAIAKDFQGNVFIAGVCNGDGPGAQYRFLTIKYDPNGALLWRAATVQSATFYPAGAFALAVDGAGYAYVTGCAINPITQADDFLTISYDPAGNERWRAYGNVGQASIGYVFPETLNLAADLKLDADRNVYVTGRRFNGHDFDYATIKYDVNGFEQWRAFANGAGNGHDRAYSIAVDGANVYVTGESFNGEWFEPMTIRYSASGIEQWRHTSNNKDDNGAAFAIGLLPGNAIYIAGDAVGATTPPGIMTEKLLDPVAATTLTSSANPSPSGQPVTFTATVIGNLPTGTVNFRDGVATLCSNVALTKPKKSDGNTKVGTCATALLKSGPHGITAIYSGDASNAGSVSPTLVQAVTPSPPGITLTSSPKRSHFGANVTFTATITGNAATGTVDFLDGTSSICAAVPLQGGTTPKATCTTAALAIGKHSITAVYSGDANNGPVTSSVLPLRVKR